MTKAEQSRVQKEIVDSLDANPHGRLLLAPRTGKSKIAIDIIKRDKPASVLWVTPSSKLADEDIPNEFDIWKAKKYKKSLTTCTWMSLHKMTGNYALIILDEEQFATENNMLPLLSGALKCGNIITLTGTASKHDHKKEIYKKLNLEVLVNLSINAAVDMKLLANYKINVVEVDMGTKNVIEAGNAQKKFMTSELKQYTYLHNTAQQAIFQRRSDMTFRILARMRAIKGSPAKTAAAQWLIEHLEGRKLIFSATIAQAETLSDHTYHSKTDNIDLQKFLHGSIDTIAMVNAGGTGFTYKALDHLILTQTDSDKNGLTSQKISRTLLDQGDYEATIWILSLVGTQDEKWVDSVLQNFDKKKVKYLRFKNMVNNLEEAEVIESEVPTIPVEKDPDNDGWITIKD
jgi:superfamily II DNA or RNA helicase